jgi:hypothetical protein
MEKLPRLERMMGYGEVAKVGEDEGMKKLPRLEGVGIWIGCQVGEGGRVCEGMERLPTLERVVGKGGMSTPAV